MYDWEKIFKDETEKYHDYVTSFPSDSYGDAERYLEAYDVFMDDGLRRYECIAQLCKENGIRQVYDIGCNVALQSKIFKEYGIKYIGIEQDPYSLRLAPVADGISYICNKYPFSVDVTDKEHTAAVSELCVGFEARGEKVWEILSCDFNYYIGLPGDGDYNKDWELFRNLFHVVKAVSVEGLPCYFSVNKKVLEKQQDIIDQQSVVLPKTYQELFNINFSFSEKRKCQGR